MLAYERGFILFSIFNVIPAEAGIWIVMNGIFLYTNPDLGHTPRVDSFEMN